MFSGFIFLTKKRNRRSKIESPNFISFVIAMLNRKFLFKEKKLLPKSD